MNGRDVITRVSNAIAPKAACCAQLVDIFQGKSMCDFANDISIHGDRLVCNVNTSFKLFIFVGHKNEFHVAKYATTTTMTAIIDPVKEKIQTNFSELCAMLQWCRTQETYAVSRMGHYAFEAVRGLVDVEKQMWVIYNEMTDCCAFLRGVGDTSVNQEAITTLRNEIFTVRALGFVQALCHTPGETVRFISGLLDSFGPRQYCDGDMDTGKPDDRVIATGCSYVREVCLFLQDRAIDQGTRLLIGEFYKRAETQLRSVRA